MVNQNPAARAQRQTLQVIALREIGGYPIGGGGGSDQRIAYGQPADLHGRGRVSLHQGGGDSQRVRNVVETFARVIGGQQGGGIDIEGEQIADGVGVFDSIEPVQPWVSRIRMECRSVIELHLQLGCERV